MNEYEIAWNLLSDSLLQKTSWGRREIQTLMSKCLTDSQSLVLEKIKNEHQRQQQEFRGV